MIAEKPRCCQCVLTEKLGNTGLLKSAYGSSLLKDPALGTLGKLAYSAVSEGAEEFSEGLADPLLKNLTYEPAAVAAFAETLLPSSGGIGVYPTFVHVDVREQRSRWKETN